MSLTLRGTIVRVQFPRHINPLKLHFYELSDRNITLLSMKEHNTLTKILISGTELSTKYDVVKGHIEGGYKLVGKE